MPKKGNKEPLCTVTCHCDYAIRCLRWELKLHLGFDDHDDGDDENNTERCKIVCLDGRFFNIAVSDDSTDVKQDKKVWLFVTMGYTQRKLIWVKFHHIIN